ncbi:hypothetical protein E4T48_02553 [Aureobasidium sp. EXF-10727]|nr:hypothetical protein E4T48_02553 [Aureobasidium sp. EXF-10727]
MAAASILDSIITQISAMRNRLPIPVEEDPDERTDVLNQAPVDQPAGLPDITITEVEGGVSVTEFEDLSEMTITEPAALFTMSGISMQEVAPVVPVSQDQRDNESENESVAASQTSVVDESWIPLDPRIAAPLVEIVVQGHSFSVSRHMLCMHSQFFKRALNGSFREAIQGRIVLNERLDLFQIFNHWLSQPRSRYPLDFVEKSFDVAADVDGKLRQLAFLDIYIFADRLQILHLGRAALVHFDKVIRPSGRPSRASVTAICEADLSLLKDDGLWKYLIAIERDANRCGAPCRPAEDYGHLPDMFIFQLLKMTEAVSKPTLEVGNMPVDLFELKKKVNDQGGYEKIEQGRRWGVVCKQMGIRLDNHRFNSMQLRDIYRTWLGPFDTEVEPQERSRLKIQCPRPLVKHFY